VTLIGSNLWEALKSKGDIVECDDGDSKDNRKGWFINADGRAYIDKMLSENPFTPGQFVNINPEEIKIMPDKKYDNEILNERDATHGPYEKTARYSQGLKKVINVAIEEEPCYLTAIQKETLDMLCCKIARILSGNNNEVDHWKDIAGYADLAAAELEE
jgi:glucosamine 6-phosphate synthetase-like amidotransferase/phosphosugar isomerase protein